MSDCWPKVWGTNIELFRDSSVSVNLLQLVKGGVCSWHFHSFKHNKFYVVNGRVLIRTEHNETILEPGKSFVVVPPLKHQFEALENSWMIEIMFVEYNDSDITRITEGFRRS